MEISLAPDTLGHIGNMPITNGLIATVVVTILLIVVAIKVKNGLQTVPKGLQFWVEVILEEGEKFMDTVTDSRQLTRKVFPFIMTIFLFFLFSNLMGFIPGILAISYHGHHLFRLPTTDYNTVFTITAVSFLVMQGTTLATGGVFSFIKKFFNFSSPINFFVGIIEGIGEFARVLSLSLRLFGNMFAEEVLAMVMMFLSPYFIPVPFQIIGLGVSLIQPAAFSILVLVFIKLSMVDKRLAHH